MLPLISSFCQGENERISYCGEPSLLKDTQGTNNYLVSKVPAMHITFTFKVVDALFY